MVQLYKSKCPVGVQKCNNIEDCPAEGHCANVMFDDTIAFLIDMVHPQEHIIKFTIQQKRNLMNDLKLRCPQLFSKWDPSMELILLCASGDTARTKNGLKELLRASLCFINDVKRRNSGRGEYVHHVSGGKESLRTIVHHYGDTKGWPFVDGVNLDELEDSFLKQLMVSVVNPITRGGKTYCILVTKCADQPYVAKLNNTMVIRTVPQRWRKKGKMQS